MHTHTHTHVHYTKKKIVESSIFWLIFISASMNFTFTSPMLYHINPFHFLTAFLYIYTHTRFDCTDVDVADVKMCCARSHEYIYLCIFVRFYICLYVCLFIFGSRSIFILPDLPESAWWKTVYYNIHILCVRATHRNMINNHNNNSTNSTSRSAHIHTYMYVVALFLEGVDFFISAFSWVWAAYYKKKST